MEDRTPSNIIALFLLLSALSLIPYLVHTSRYRAPGQSSITPLGFLAAITEVTLIAAACIAFLGTDNLILATALGVGIGLAILHPVAAICFFFSLLFLRPWEFLHDNSLLKVLPRLMAAITTCSWGLGMFRRGRTTVVVGRPSILFILLLGWIGTSTLFSITPGASLRSFFESFSPTSVLVFLMLNSLCSRKDLEAFLRNFILAGLGIVSVAFYITCRDYISGASDFRLHSVGLWGNANDIAALAVLMLPLGLRGSQTNLGMQRRVLGITTSLPFVAALLWSQSRAAQGAALLAGLVYLLFCSDNKRLGCIIAGVVVGLATVVSAAMPQRDLADTSGSSESRYNYMIAGLRMARAHPLFGVGVGNYPYLYEQFTPAFIECGNRTAHSTWVLALSETGVAGLFLLWALYGSVGSHAWSLRKRAPYYILSTITYGVAMSFLSHTYLFLPYVFMALVLASARCYRNEREHGTGKSDPLAHHAHRTPLAIPHRHLFGIFIPLLLAPLELTAAEEISFFGAQAGINKPLGHIESRFDHAITLRGSRNETLAFMIKAQGMGCFPLHVVNTPSALHNPPLKLSFYSLPRVKTEHPSFPGAHVGDHLDPVVPLHSPAELCLKADLLPEFFLGEVSIPKDYPPGSVALHISAAGQMIDVTLVVWPMTIPDKPALPAYSELTPWFLTLGHHGKWHESEADLARTYTAAMLEHRVAPLKCNIAPLQENEQGTPRALNLTTLPSPRSSFDSVVLSGRPSWAYYDFPTVGANGARPIDFDKAALYFGAVENTIPAVHREGRSLVYLWDEPKKGAWQDLLKLSHLVKQRAPSLKQLVTTTYSAQLESTVDIFAPVMDQFDTPHFPPPSAYRTLQGKGHETWWYVSCMSHGCDALGDSGVPDMVIDRPSSYIRAIGWLSMRYSIDAFLYYSVNNGFQFSPKRDPWQSLWDFSGNGDGTLFYPGRPGERGLTTHQPISSLRLKLWRESSYDAEYIAWMRALPDVPSWWTSANDRIAHSTTSWSRDYTQYQDLRDRAGSYLATFLDSAR